MEYTDVCHTNCLPIAELSLRTVRVLVRLV